MKGEDELLKLCLEKPTDTERLLVYADWLEEKGDPRAEYARGQLELRRAKANARPAKKKALRSLYPLEHTAWCGRLEAAGVFEANLLEVKEMWWGVGLGKRESSATYQGFAYHQQPPLPVGRFDGSFIWLRAAKPIDPPRKADREWPTRIRKLRAEGWQVPLVFEQFICDGELLRRIPSCTANFFLPGKDAEVHPLDEESRFITFYSDSQSCVLWGIRVGKGDDSYAPILGGVPESPDEEPAAGEPYFSFPSLTFSAPTLESFIYRWWMENTIWFATRWPEGQRALTADEQAYLDHLKG